MEWLEKLSGPGPFGRKYPGVQASWCLKDSSGDKAERLAACLRDDGDSVKILFVVHYGQSSTGLQPVFDNTQNLGGGNVLGGQPQRSRLRQSVEYFQVERRVAYAVGRHHRS